VKRLGKGCLYGLAAIGALVVACTVLGAIASAGRRSSQQTETLSSNAAGAARATPTFVPTIAPFAEHFEDAGRSGVSPDLVAYLLRAAEPADRYGKALRSLGEQARQVREQPALLRDSTWQRETLAVLARLRSAGRQLGNLEPVPPEARRLDGLLDQIAAETEPMADEYSQVVQRFDLRTLGSASRRLGRVAELVGQVGRELENLRR
jgi:hypothetical protein